MNQCDFLKAMGLGAASPALSRPLTVAMREGDWKILADKKMTKFELYNLRNDISEKHNIAERQPKRLAAMKKTIAKLHAEIEAEEPRWR